DDHDSNRCVSCDRLSDSWNLWKCSSWADAWNGAERVLFIWTLPGLQPDFWAGHELLLCQRRCTLAFGRSGRLSVDSYHSPIGAFEESHHCGHRSFPGPHWLSSHGLGGGFTEYAGSVAELLQVKQAALFGFSRVLLDLSHAGEQTPWGTAGRYGLMGIAGLLEDGNVPRSQSIFSSAALSTMCGAVLGTSPVIIANESSAGIIEGARTGLSATVVACLFVASAFLTPVLSSIPRVATSVPLVLIGAFMMAPCRGIDWDNLRAAIPSFLTITVVPFTYSIHNGIIAGILMDAFLMISAGKVRFSSKCLAVLFN
ncbi:unnamed protein product, partial [Durusdinium trenchii]